LLSSAEIVRGEHCAYRHQIIAMVGVYAITRLPRPKGVVIESDFLVCNVTKHHATEASIAHGHGFDPCVGWLTVPQAVRVHRRTPCWS
jgi:hypothetical protein